MSLSITCHCLYLFIFLSLFFNNFLKLARADYPLNFNFLDLYKIIHIKNDDVTPIKLKIISAI